MGDGLRMETLDVQRVRGMNDALPPDDARLRGLAVHLRDHFERFGYRGIDTPVLENLDLHPGKIYIKGQSLEPTAPAAAQP